MALFGYPVAQENDAERAVRAALAIQQGARRVEPQERRAPGSQRSRRASPSTRGRWWSTQTGEIFGDVPNIAARAQALAEPGSVVVTARVQRQVAGLFVAEDAAAMN